MPTTNHQIASARRYLRKAFFLLLWALGITKLWHCLQHDKVTVLLLHGVMSPTPGELWRPLRSRLPVEDLDRYLRRLSRWYHFVSFDDAVGMIRGDTPLSGHSLTITFDDGYRNNLTRALPVLRRHGAPGILFVTTGPVGNREPFWFDRVDYALQQGLGEARTVTIGSHTVTLGGWDRDQLSESFRQLRRLAKTELQDDLRFVEWMRSFSADLEGAGATALATILEVDEWSAPATWNEIRRAASTGLTIGSHTVTHVRLPKVPIDVARRELQQSKADIEREMGMPCSYLAYPNGDADAVTGRSAEELGYTAAVTTREGLNSVGDSLFLLKRINLPGGMSSAELLAEVSGLSNALAKLKFFGLSHLGRLGLRQPAERREPVDAT